MRTDQSSQNARRRKQVDVRMALEITLIECEQMRQLVTPHGGDQASIVTGTADDIVAVDSRHAATKMVDFHRWYLFSKKSTPMFSFVTCVP